MKKLFANIRMWLKKHFGPEWTAEDILRREG